MTVRTFISVDMEGIGGTTTVRQVTRGTDDYAWARQLMTQETNAAIAGAADAGARCSFPTRTATWAISCRSSSTRAQSWCRARRSSRGA